MLANMSPGKFNERLAHSFVEPWGNEMRIASEVGAAIINKITRLGMSEVSERDFLRPDHFLPQRDDSEELVPQHSYVQTIGQRMRQ